MPHLSFKCDRERWKTIQKVAEEIYDNNVSAAIKSFIPKTRVMEEIEDVPNI